MTEHKSINQNESELKKVNEKIKNAFQSKPNFIPKIIENPGEASFGLFSYPRYIPFEIEPMSCRWCELKLYWRFFNSARGDNAISTYHFLLKNCPSFALLNHRILNIPNDLDFMNDALESFKYSTINTPTKKTLKEMTENSRNLGLSPGFVRKHDQEPGRYYENYSFSEPKEKIKEFSINYELTDGLLKITSVKTGKKTHDEDSQMFTSCLMFANSRFIRSHEIKCHFSDTHLFCAGFIKSFNKFKDESDLSKAILEMSYFTLEMLCLSENLLISKTGVVFKYFGIGSEDEMRKSLSFYAKTFKDRFTDYEKSLVPTCLNIRKIEARRKIETVVQKTYGIYSKLMDSVTNEFNNKIMRDKSALQFSTHELWLEFFYRSTVEHMLVNYKQFEVYQGRMFIPYLEESDFPKYCYDYHPDKTTETLKVLNQISTQFLDNIMENSENPIIKLLLEASEPLFEDDKFYQGIQSSINI